MPALTTTAALENLENPDPDIAISIRNLTKKFFIYDHPTHRLLQFFVPKIQQALGKGQHNYFKEFTALDNIHFDVHRGETVGIVGRNGSGKSTLLQIICGTLSPTGGQVRTHGRIGALLELGSGFNPDFSGYDNVYLNAAVLGMSKEEIDAKFDNIASFADIGDFIYQPVKTYSSGMVVRLAFAVQAQIDPDILIVDEALSVGDARFQAKCFKRLEQLKNNGTSILLVTHAGEQVVTHCNRAVLLDRSKQIMVGAPKTVVNKYLDILFGKEKAITSTASDTAPDEPQKTAPTEAAPDIAIKESVLSVQLSQTDDIFHTHPHYNSNEYRWGDRSASILDFHIQSLGVAYPNTFENSANVHLALSIRFHKTILRPILGFTIKSKEGITLYGSNTELLDIEAFKEMGQANTTTQVALDFRCLLGAGDYFISLGIASREGEEIIPHDRRYDSIHLVIEPTEAFFGLTNLSLNIHA